MKWFPWISSARHEAESALWLKLLAACEERIKELEQERRLLWDKICLLGIGAPMFSPVAELEKTQEPEKKQSSPEAPRFIRPSQIMRHMDRVAEARWLRKCFPAMAAKLDRDKVMNKFDGIDGEKRP